MSYSYGDPTAGSIQRVDHTMASDIRVEETDPPQLGGYHSPSHQAAQDHRAPPRELTLRVQLRNIWKELWWAIILAGVFATASTIAHFVSPKSSTIIFTLAFLAIIGLAKILAFATDELSEHVGETLAGLINATLGNAVELIVAILALVKCELRIVQSSLIGSILSNSLLVLGLCFFAGGTRFSEQGFAVDAAQLNLTLLFLSVTGVIIPVGFNIFAGGIEGFESETKERDILKLSHGTAVILLLVYAAYLYFQFSSHKSLFDQGASKLPTVEYSPRKKGARRARVMSMLGRRVAEKPPVQEGGEPVPDAEMGLAETEAGTVGMETGTVETEDEDEGQKLSLAVSIGLLVFVTAVVGFTAEWLVASIDGMTSSGAIGKEFVGLILLPIVGNAAEHATAVTVSVKDKLTLSISVAIGSSIQIAMFVIPFIVVLGWIIGHPLSMLFDPFESTVLFLTVLTVTYTISDGKSNWLEGTILVALYMIVALVFWFYPGTELTGLLTCSA